MELKRLCINTILTNYPPPKNSRLESDGSRTVMVSVDIMTNGGTKFFATFRRRMPVHFDFELRGYAYNVTDLEDMILERYPSLEGKEWKIAF